MKFFNPVVTMHLNSNVDAKEGLCLRHYLGAVTLSGGVSSRAEPFVPSPFGMSEEKISQRL